MIISAYLGVAGLSDLGYQFFDSAEAASGSRITAGIVNAGDGWYSASATIPSNSISVRWNSSGSPGIVAREYYRSLGDPLVMDIPDGYPAGSVGKIIGDNLDAKVSTRLDTATWIASYITPPSADTIAAATRDVNNQTPAANSLGAAINAAASAGDPWATNLPGSYGAGTAGNRIGSFIDETVSSRMAAASFIASPTKEVIAAAVRDVDNTSPVAGSMGDKINAAASAGDPWSTLLPGTYGAGTAGKLMSDNLDVKVSTRLSSSGYTVPPTVTEIANNVRDVDNRTPAVNSLGAAVNSAASAGDPWATVLPGSYGPNTAGDLIGTNLNAQVSTRLGTTDYVIPPSVIAISESVRDVNNVTPAANSLGAMVKAGSDAGDPWAASLPGSYAAGSAGQIVGGNLDATVSSRSTYAGTDTPGTTTLLTRVPNAITVTGGKVDVNDKTGFSLTNEYDAAKTAAQEGDAMTLAPGERATLAAEIWNTLTSALTLAGSIGKWIVDKLDATVGSRLASASYVAPDNAGIAAIKSKTDALPASPASVSDIPTASQNAVATRDVNNTNPAPESLGVDVKAGAAGGDPWTIHVPGSYSPGTAGDLLGNNLDAKVSSRLASSDITLNNGEVTVGTNNDKDGYSLVGGGVSDIADEILKRDWQLVSGEAAYSVLNALRFLRDAWEVKPDGTLVVYKENGQIAWTRTCPSRR